MTFFVESTGDYPVELTEKGNEYEIDSTHIVIWVFYFHTTNETKKLTGTIHNGEAVFEIPKGFLTLQRIGEVDHYVATYGNNFVPLRKTFLVYDKLVRNGPTLKEAGITIT